MKAELEAQQQQQLDEQAMEAARQQAEGRAKQQLEVSLCSGASARPTVSDEHIHRVLCGPDSAHLWLLLPPGMCE